MFAASSLFALSAPSSWTAVADMPIKRMSATMANIGDGRTAYVGGTYFGSEPIPWPAMRLYQAQTALTSLAASTTTSAAKCGDSAESASPTVSKSWIQRQIARHTFAFVEDRMEKIRRDRILRMPTLMQLETLGGRG